MNHEEFKEKIFIKRPDVKSIYNSFKTADTLLDNVRIIYNNATREEQESIASLISTNYLKILDPVSDERSDYMSQLSILVCILDSLGYKLDITKKED